jgi:hypothetical protein
MLLLPTSINRELTLHQLRHAEFRYFQVSPAASSLPGETRQCIFQSRHLIVGRLEHLADVLTHIVFCPERHKFLRENIAKSTTYKINLPKAQ